MEPRIVLDKKALEKYMDEKNLTMHKLADSMKVEPSTIYRVTSGDTDMSSKTMAKMMDAFGLEEHDLSRLFIFVPSLHKYNETKA